MATGFKKATVNASDVPATQTNFPSYVDLSRLGITTLAEAESVRVYADSGKTTEWAREIVSATEMHVKVPSLTSTVEMYVDYDGVRSDYGVTDTYGRNAVWSGYRAVYHLKDTSDATGNGNTLTASNVTYSAAKVGNGAEMNGTNATFTAPIVLTNVGSISMCFKNASTTQDGSKVMFGSTKVGTSDYIRYYEGGTPYPYKIAVLKDDLKYLASHTANTNWHHVTMAWDTATAWNTFHDAATLYTGSAVKNPTNTGYNLRWGATANGLGIYGSSYWAGTLDEIRMKDTRSTANWAYIESNNLSNESSFWGTWTDAGGGSSYRFVPQIRPFAGL